MYDQNMCRFSSLVVASDLEKKNVTYTYRPVENLQCGDKGILVADDTAHTCAKWSSDSYRSVYEKFILLLLLFTNTYQCVWQCPINANELNLNDHSRFTLSSASP